jgi:hypothetical protein
MGDTLPMASGAHDSDHGHDDHGHDAHGHDAHGHDAHGPADDAWVLIPIGVGLVIGIVLLVVLGLGAVVAPYS